jgi:peroxiredoxin
MDSRQFGRGLVYLLAGIAWVAAWPAEAPASPVDRLGEKLQDAALRDLKGREARLLSLAKGRVLVIAYTGLGCPISGRYAPRLEEIRTKFKGKPVAFIGVNANPQDSLKAIARSAKELGYGFPIYQDMNQALTRQLDAKTSTEVFVIDREGVIRYRGMIDDQYALGEKRDRPRHHHLRKAIEAALKGQFPHTRRTAAPGCVITRTPEKKADKPAKVTYASHIAGILQRHCVECHRPGQVGPFPLTSYEQAAGWSAMIDLVVRDGRMPPWNADDEFDGVFKNQRKLSKKDRQALLAWIEAGMPRGDPAREPAAKKYPKAWRIGKPDRVFTMQESFLVPKDGTVEYKFFNIPTDYKDDKWIVAMEARPGAPEVVHHILAFIIEPKKGNVVSSRLGLEDGFLCATVPGDTPAIFPPGCAKRLPAGATIVLQMHYTTSGKAASDRSSLAVRFAREPIEHEVRTRGIYNMTFEIPAGAENHEVRAEYTTDSDIEVTALFPHMHTRGKDWTYLVKYPDGKEKKILSVSRYDFNWQESYLFATPLLLPRGSRVQCIAHFDNSAGNFDNPDPKSPVKWGEQTWEEMMIGYIDWIPARPGSGEAVGRLTAP